MEEQNPGSKKERTENHLVESAETSESGTVQTTDIKTHYIRRGDGPPIVFIHGMAMSAIQWESQMETLSNEYTTVAYDVRGHGYTGGSDRESYTMELYAADLDALLTTLDIEDPVLCGLSMGGCIAQMYAATYPEKVAGLVVSDTFTAAPLPLTGRLIFANLRFFGLLDRFVRYTTLNRFQTWVGNRMSPGVAGDGVTVQRLMEKAPRISHREFVKIANSMARFPRSDLDASQITTPTLVMHGENLPAVLQDMHRRLAEGLINADIEFTVVPDAGHASNIDNPDFFSATVQEFLSRITLTRSQRF
ncbi:alpha/beta hydrolase [Halogeometricum sp. S1BR25-6]|uniref:Alpha/beta hydrolase n=1 Tax=Halogeometricum salsisoli TaxID=2950536 RepID=A0ABU2GJV7_9EURY|nr:alpha/beta hydrolase [Halogeometricum sp. S1BR25-6]MDS0301106.1 alpha/beta hydrolase [Halogeometricum sp. S1BR25-6]